jgi:hypothetical protein
LLRLRNFTLGKKLSDNEVVGPGGLERIADLVACLVPFVSSPFRFTISKSFKVQSTAEPFNAPQWSY